MAKSTCDADFTSCDISLFGGLITGVSANYSWGQSGGTLSVSVVDQPVCDGDDETSISFCPPKLGSPVCLNLSCDDNSIANNTNPILDQVLHNDGSISLKAQTGSSAAPTPDEGWKYIGLLDSWDETTDANSGKKYEVRLTDPASIADGYQIILDGYDGQVFGVRNLFNLKGFLMSKNGKYILQRTLVNCGCKTSGNDYDDQTNPANDWIYPSEFITRDGSLESHSQLFNKLGLKWHLENKDTAGRPKIGGGGLEQSDDVTKHLFNRKTWDGSEANEAGIPAVLIYESLKALTTGHIKDNNQNSNRWNQIAWNSLEEIRDWTRAPSKTIPTGPIWEYWQPPKWRDHFYLIDLEALGDILYSGSAYNDVLTYRINSDKTSLLEFVDQVCKDHGYDWQFYLEVNEDINRYNPCASYGSNCGEAEDYCSADSGCWYFDPYRNTANLSGGSSVQSEGSGLTIKLRVFKIDLVGTQDEEDLASIEGNAYQDCVNTVETGSSRRTTGRTECPKLISGSLGQAENGKVEFTSVQKGIEYSKETKNAFVVGDRVKTIHQVIYKETDDPKKATIWPYWGKNPVDPAKLRLGTSCEKDILTMSNPIAGRGYGDLHFFDVDSSDWGIGQNKYRITVMELQHALKDQDAWMTFYGFAAAINSPTAGLTGGDFFRGHYDIHKKFNFPTGFYLDMMNRFLDGKGQDIEDVKDDPAALKKHLESIFNELTSLFTRSPNKEDAIRQAKHTLNLTFDWEDETKLDDDTKAKAVTDRLFNHVKAIADEYLGRKFIVPLPFVCGYMQGNSITNRNAEHYFGIKTNWEATDSAWTEQNSVLGLKRAPHNNPRAQDLGTSFFEKEDGTVECFVRFNCVENMDLSGFDKEDVYIEQSQSSGNINATGVVYIRAEVEEIVRSVDDTPHHHLANYRKQCSDCSDMTVAEIKEKLLFTYWSEGSPINQTSGLSLNVSDKDASYNDKISCFPTYSHPNLKYNKTAGYLYNKSTAHAALSLKENFGFGYSAVIVLPGPALNNDDKKDTSSGYFLDLMKDFLFAKNIVIEEIHQSQIKAIHERKFGIDSLLNPSVKDFFVPAAVAIPLVSKVHSYGPYYSNRKDHKYPGLAQPPHDAASTKEHLGGKTEVIIDNSINPWSYGSVGRMNYAGGIIANEARTTSFVAEQGQLTAVGLPRAHLGDKLSTLIQNSGGNPSGGPVITDIRVSQSSVQGVTTTYGFKTHFRRFGTLEKSRISQLQRITAERMRQYKLIKDAAISGGQISGGMFSKILNTLKRTQGAVEKQYKRKTDNANTSHHFIYGDAYDSMIPSSSWEVNKERSFGQIMDGTFYEDALPGLRADTNEVYQRKVGVEHKGIFRQFSTKTDHTFISHYQKDVKANNENSSTMPVEKTDTSDSEKINNFFSQEQVPPIDNEYNMPITVQTLNPFKTDRDRDEMFGFKWMNKHACSGDNKSDKMGTSKYHDIDFVVRGSAFPVNMSIRTEYESLSSQGEEISHGGNYRAISLRGPLILTGWGFDINNNPVPSQKKDDGNCDEEDHCGRFLQDWLRKPHTWKTGPVDLRWDEARGLWTAPSTMKLIQVNLCECLDRAHGSKALGVVEGEKKQKQLNSATKACEDVDKKCPDCGEESPCGKCETEGSQANKDVQTVTVFNASGKVVNVGTQVMAYYDTVKKKYLVITAPEPMFEAVMTAPETDSPGEEGLKVMPPGKKGKATLVKSFDVAGVTNCKGEDSTVEIINTLKHPICYGKKVFVRLTQCWEKESEKDEDEYDFKGEVLQAEFDALTVVSSVDCYEDEYGNPTLEICDRVIYLESAWSIEDCGNDDVKKRNDTKGWNPSEDDDEGTSITVDKQEYWECAEEE